MNERKGGGDDETAAAGDDDAEDASDGGWESLAGKVSRAASSTLPRSLVIRVTRDRLRVTIESISQLRTVRYLNPYYVIP